MLTYLTGTWKDHYKVNNNDENIENSRQRRDLGSRTTHDGHGVDGGVVLLDEELDECRVALHGGVVEGRPARLRLAVDERVPLQQRLAYLSISHLHVYRYLNSQPEGATTWG